MRVRGSARWLAFVLAAAACAGGCDRSKAGEPASSGAAPAERSRVLAFWRELEAANGARLNRDCAGAIERYERALALDARHEDALYYLGQCLRDTGQPARARQAFERLVSVNPASARGHLALGALLASPDASEPIDLEQAEAHLQRAHAINGEETGPVVRLGEVALVSGRPREARQWFEAALRTNPKSVEAAFLAGFVGWDGGAEPVPLLARRVVEAAKVVAPVKGVLSEGDRRDAKHATAPPLESPLGRLLFGAPIAALRGRAAAGEDVDPAAVVALWKQARGLRTTLQRRAAGVAGSR